MTRSNNGYPVSLRPIQIYINVELKQAARIQAIRDGLNFSEWVRKTIADRLDQDLKANET